MSEISEDFVDRSKMGLEFRARARTFCHAKYEKQEF